jgi:nucleotide-binding universal stress UspA family protein
VNTILVGFAQSDSAARALARAADVAEAFGARLVVVCVAEHLAPVGEPALEPVPLVAPPGGGMAPVPLAAADLGPASTAVPEPEELARHDLERARSYLLGRHLDAEYVAEVGDPAERLLDAAERYDADLIVVGGREHGLLERLLARPVEDTVARRAERDVLLVH